MKMKDIMCRIPSALDLIIFPGTSGNVHVISIVVHVRVSNVELITYKARQAVHTVCVLDRDENL